MRLRPLSRHSCSLKPAARWWGRASLLAGLLMAAAGCETVQKYSLTAKLGDTENFRKWSEPAPGPNVALSETKDGQDILVQYDAFSEKHAVVKRQAYYA